MHKENAELVSRAHWPTNERGQRLCLAWALSLLATLTVCPGQAPDGIGGSPLPKAVRSALSGIGAIRAEGKILGMGPGYRAWFDREGVAFGAEGQRSPALQWCVETVGRRTSQGVRMVPVDSASPSLDGEVVCYARGVCSERYEMRSNGIEQSFVFDRLPEGEGDLIVRGRLTTSLVAGVEGEDVEQVLFLGTVAGGASIGGVKGVDAEGALAPGLVRLERGHLDVILPEAFVRSASLPLVLDPLIGLPFPMGHQGGVTPIGFSCAYDASSEVFLVGWTESNVCLGRLVSPGGELRGPVLCLECDASYQGHLTSIAGVRAGSRFVAWINGYFPVTVDAASGEVHVETSIPTATTSAFRWDVLGGDARLGHADVVLAEVDFQQASIVATELDVESSGAITVGASLTLGPATPTFPGTTVAVSKSGGVPGRWLVVWDDQNLLYGAVLDRDLNVLDQRILVASAEDKSWPLVDGDGRQWLVMYDTPTATKCLPVFWSDIDRAAWVGNERVLVSGNVADPWGVGWLGESVIVTTAGVRSPSNYAVTSLDPFTCLPCEGKFVTAPSTYVMATQRNGDPAVGDIALLSDPFAIGQLYRANDGSTTDLGGGCGDGGWSAASCARIGNDAFRLRLRDARRGIPAYVALGVSELGYTCGSCTLVPDPLFVLGVSLTDPSHGNAELPLPLPNIPSLVGATFLFQWLTIAGTACPLGLEFSNALSVQLQ